MARKRYTRRRYYAGFPEPNSSDWFSIGNKCVWLPFDKRERFRKPASILEINRFAPGWAIAGSALNCIMRCSGYESIEYEIDRTGKLGEGLNRETYWNRVKFVDAGVRKKQLIVVSLLPDDADHKTGRRAIKEQKMLEWLHQRSTSFLVPEPFGIVWFGGMMAFATSYMEGVPVELRASKTYGKPPWELVGSIAAEIHRLPVQDLPSDLPGTPTWRDHVVDAVKEFHDLETPEVREAIAWIKENLPPGEPSVLLHCDLLGQNILWPLSDKYCVLDWEYSRLGDPAYDLAIVTRGVRRPFKVPEGLDYLIDSYRGAGGPELAKSNIQVHELLMLLNWYKWSLEGTYGGHGPDQYLARIKSYLRRL